MITETTEPVTEVHPLRWANARIPMTARGLTWEDYRKANPHARVPLEKSVAFCESFPQRYISQKTPLADYPEDRLIIGRGLVLGGSPRTGKTMLLSILLQQVALTHGVKVIYATMADYISAMIELQRLQKRADQGDPTALAKYRTIEDFLDIVRRAPFVGLDDVGKEHKTSSGFAEDEFDRLLRNRHDGGRPTAMTTNVSIDKWAMYHESMPGFIADVYDVVPVVKPERRGRAA